LSGTNKMEDLKSQIKELKAEIELLKTNTQRRQTNQVQTPLDITSQNVLKNFLSNSDIVIKKLESEDIKTGNLAATTVTGETINSTSHTTTNLQFTNVVVGGSNGINATVSFLDGDGVTVRTLTFKKGVLTNYTAV
jgi:hypothetical protein